MKIKSYLLSFAKTKGSIAAALVAVLMAANTTVALAQNKTTESNGTENTIGGVDKLFGIDPSSKICTSKGTAETDGDKIVCLYNVGAKKFLSIGGMWGTHASLDVTPYTIYMKLIGDSEGKYRLENKVKGSANLAYLGIDTKHIQVFMDQGAGDRSIIRFDKATDYSETNKVYLVKIGNPTTLGYLTAYPGDENKLCDYQKTLAAKGTQEYKNQEWKVITKNEYYLLFNTSPAYMKSPVDASFLIACPDFRVNDADAQKWNITGEGWKDKLRFGDEHMYKKYDKLSSTGTKDWVGYTDQTHQQKYGQYFYCYTKGLRGFTFYQDVKVHKGGWFLLRCNGFSTSNSSENITTNGKPLANLFITVLDANNNPIDDKYSTATLNGISQADAYQLAKTHNGKPYEGAGIGHAFFEGEYENQVQICLDKAPNGKEITSDNPVTLRIGFYVDPTPDGKPEVAEDELTAVDEFKLLYAGPRRNPELILDEESTNLRYLTEAADEYKNSVLHLNRKLNDNMWNSLILPVDLTWGQMKRTFGDAVKVAKLEALTENSVQFVTVEPDSDEQVMVKAFEPYIVYPPYTQVKSAPYTVDRFYTSVGEDNSEWLGEDYKPSKDENNRLTKTLKADHYDITMVTLNRDTLKKYLNTTNWESITKFKTIDGNYGKMVCIGTMAKTYENGKIIDGRDNLNGDYFMYKGKLIQVPSGNKENSDEPYSYGLKAFRCWFELTDKTTGKPSQVSLLIDGVEDSTTGIDDIHGNTDCTSYKRSIDGVFNMNGQMVRRSCSLEGLPKGMYVVNGKKIIIR